MEKPVFPTADTEKMLTLPMGAISPLWLMFAGAATVGAAYFWSRTFFKPTNLEALTALPEAAVEAATEVVETVVATAEVAAETVVDVMEAEAEAVAAAVDTLVEAAPEPFAEVLAALAPEPVAPMSPDDLTTLTGVGPKLAARITNELKDKVGGLQPMVPLDGGRGAAPATLGGAAEDAVSALVNLGYRRIDAFGAVTGAQRRLGADASIETLIRAGLAELAS